jgi:subtilisin-like proprotein convertase family protein
MNGNWNLFVVDDANLDAGSMTSWSITFEMATAVWSPASGLYSNPTATIPYVAGTQAGTVYFMQSPTTTTSYTYTVTNVLGTCSSASATVTVTVNPAPVISVSPTGQCGPVTLTATGNSNTYAWSPASGLSTTTGAVVSADPSLNTTYTVTGTLTATGCTATATAVVNATPKAPIVIPSSITLCANTTSAQLTVTATRDTTANGGAITIPAGAPGTTSGVSSPYPSTISVGGLPASGVRVKAVRINGLTHTFSGDIDIVLQSPTGVNTILMSDVGIAAITNVNLVLDDAASGNIPATVVSGTYKPTNTAGPDNFPAPGPGNITNVNPTLSSFTGNLNGTWNLYVVDDAGGDVGTIASWNIIFETGSAVWTPVTGLFLDAAATIPYVAGTMSSPVFAKPASTTTYTVTRASATCTSPSTSVTVTVIQPLTIITPPANQSVCAGATATFSIVTGGNFPSYQWQISTNGGTTWTPIAGANNASLVLPATTVAMSGNQYRVVMTNTCSSITSAAATLTVNPLPTVTAGSLPSRICISDTLVSLAGIGLPVGGSWTGVGISGFNFVPPATAVGTYTLTYSFTNTFGCTATASTIAKVEDCPERIRLLRDNAVILFPNPNNGRFNIRINSVLYNYLNMKVFTSTGQLVKNQDFGGLVYGRIVNIDLSYLATDIYMVRFYYNDGVRTSEKTFKVIIGGH